MWTMPSTLGEAIRTFEQWSDTIWLTFKKQITLAAVLKLDRRKSKRENEKTSQEATAVVLVNDAVVIKDVVSDQSRLVFWRQNLWKDAHGGGMGVVGQKKSKSKNPQ